MCFKKLKEWYKAEGGFQWKRFGIKFGLMAGGFLVAIGIAAGIKTAVIGDHAAPAGSVRAAKTTALTQADADRALAWIRARMPNTVFDKATPDPEAPSLVLLHAKGSRNPIAFDPAHHLLLIGLVVNLDRPGQAIAPGRSQ